MSNEYTSKNMIEEVNDSNDSDNAEEEKPVEYGIICICEWKHDDDYPEGVTYHKYNSLEEIYEEVKSDISEKWNQGIKECGCGRKFKSIEDGLKHFKKQESIYFNPLYQYITINGYHSQSGSGHDNNDESEEEEEEESESEEK